MSKMTIGVNLYTLREQCTDLPGFKYTLSRLKDMGYTAVQVSGVALDPEVIAEALNQSGVSCVATHVAWPMVRDETQRIIDIHKMYNCKHVAIGSLPKEYFQGRSGVERFIRELPSPAEKLTTAGLTFSYHNHHFELAKIGEKTWLETLYDNSNPSHLNAEIDTCWIQHGGGDPVWWVRKMAGREPLLHVKDWGPTLSGEVRTLAVGEGNLNWAEILKAAEESGVEYVLVEQDDHYGRDPFESVEMSYKYLVSMGLR
ncbi:MAG: sugar phosphate isomerase/epimerase [Armatimonadota bacterium]|nr:sugar phosphate isomerase/epimerase [bacterium]